MKQNSSAFKMFAINNNAKFRLTDIPLELHLLGQSMFKVLNIDNTKPILTHPGQGFEDKVKYSYANNTGSHGDN